MRHWVSEHGVGRVCSSLGNGSVHGYWLSFWRALPNFESNIGMLECLFFVGEFPLVVLWF